MAKSLESVLSTLKGVEGGEELSKDVEGLVLHERNFGKSQVEQLRSKNSELLSALKSVGFEEGSEIEGFSKALKEKIELANKSREQLSAGEQQVLQLQRQMDEINSKLSKETELRTKAENDRKLSTINSSLMNKLTKRIKAPDVHAKNIITDGLVDLSDDGKTVIWKDGEAVVDLDKGLESYFDRYKDTLINEQKPGGNGSGSKGSDSSAKVMKRSAFENLSHSERRQHVLDGGTIVD